MPNADAAPKILGSGTLASGASSDSIAPNGAFGIEIGGEWSGTWSLEESCDNNATFQNCVAGNGSPSAFTTNGYWDVPYARVPGVVYRITRGPGTGTLTWRFVQ